MNTTAKVVVFPQQTSKGFPLKIRITKGRKSVYISLKMFLTESEKSRYWNETKKELRKSYKFYDKVNEELENQLRLLNININEKTDIPIKNNIQSFTEFFKEYKLDLELKKQYGLLHKTTSVFNHLELFNKNVDIKFSDLNIDFLKNFQRYLIELNVSPITQKGYFEKLRSIIKRAEIENKYNPQRNPFLGFEFLRIDVKPKCLTLQQFEHLKSVIIGNVVRIDTKANKKLPPYSHELLQTGRKFLFQYYCFGMRVSDLLLLQYKSIYESGKRLKFVMYKTKNEMDLFLGNEVLDILFEFLPYQTRTKIYKQSHEEGGKYKYRIGNEVLTINKKTEWYELIRQNLYQFSTNPEYKNKRIFSEISSELDITDKNDKKIIYSKIATFTSYYNKDLKVLSKELENESGTIFNLSSHMARHTFAYLSLLQNQSVYYISRALGHKSVKTTENYLKGFPNRHLDGQFYKVALSVNEKQSIDDKLKELISNADYDKKKKIIEFFSM